MKKQPGYELLHVLLMRGASGKRLWASMIAMATGISLLLIAVLIWWNFDQLLHGRASGDSLSSTFLTVSRRVTNDNMGRPELTVFSRKEMEALRQAPEVADVGVVQALKPTAYMSMEIAPGAGFSTVTILETVPDRFIDKLPGGWGWKPGNTTIPVILSASFLSLYNYAYAPSQGLPQLSEQTIRAIPFKIAIGEGSGAVTYTARIVGFSDRITSVLVPESFVQHANGPGGENVSASRMIVRVKDASSTAFAEFLESRGYVTNSELMRWSKVRAIVQVVAIIVGLLAMLLLGVSLLVFVLFIELSVARSRPSVQLLQEIGYSPSGLGRYMTKRFLPPLAGAIGCSVLIALLSQAAAHYLGEGEGLHLPLLPGWPVWACVLLIGPLLVLQLRRAIRQAIVQVKQMA